ncbi:MAG: nucleoside kinase [Deltaproteobacteria bacterium]|nr:nucleoside kinase [Deltaproteobacteria bacterium]
MPRDLKITVLNKEREIPEGTPVAAVVPETLDEAPVLGALVNNRLVGLDFPLFSNAEIKPVTYLDRQGESILFRSTSLLLYEAAASLYPESRIVIGQSLGNGYYFDFHGPLKLSDQIIRELVKRMKNIVAEGRKISRQTYDVSEAEEIFTRMGYHDKVRLLSTWKSSTVDLVSMGLFRDIAHGPVLNSTSKIHDFELVPYPPGLVLRFPRSGSGRPRKINGQPLLFKAYRETREWNEMLGVTNVGDLNQRCLDGSIKEIIRVAEGFHEKKITYIADQIAKECERIRLILISGPSSSGKTTTTKRLAVQLRVNGIKPVSLSMDNYYVDRDKTPRHPDGSYDFEAVEALDLDLFNQHLLDLLNGKEVMVPVFDFPTGKRKPKGKWNTARLDKDQVLLIEGIHGLNPRISESVPDTSKYKIYISALTQLCIDDHNRIFTSDSRLVRRIVRDRLFRGYSAARTLSMWPSVQAGERKYVYPWKQPTSCSTQPWSTNRRC